MAGKDGWTRPNAEMRPDSERMRTRMHGVPEGDGRWWWALNGCTSQLEGWPLGPVVGQTAPGAGMAGTDRRGPNWGKLLRERGGGRATRENKAGGGARWGRGPSAL